MKITVNSARCEAYGFCEERAPGILELDDDGELRVLKDGDLSDSEVEEATKALRACPVAALSLDGS
jgi:ferredoxin